MEKPFLCRLYNCMLRKYKVDKYEKLQNEGKTFFKFCFTLKLK